MIFALGLVPWQTVATDPVFAKTIGLTDLGVSANEFCRQLTGLTQVPITCDPAIRDDLIVLVVKHRSAREVMAKVAGEFGWTWMPTNGGYRLRPTEAFLKKAVAGRRQVLLQKGLRWQAAVKHLLDDAEGDHRDQMIAQRPAQMAALYTVANLDPDQLVQLFDRRLVFSSDPGPLELPLSPDVRDVFVKRKETFRGLEIADPDGKTISVGSLQNMEVQLDGGDQATVITEYENGISSRETNLGIPEPEAPDMTPASANAKQEFDKTPTAEPGISIPVVAPLRPFVGKLINVAARLKCDVLSDIYDDYAGLFDPGEDPDTTFDEARRKGFTPILKDGWLVNRNPEWPRCREEAIPPAVLQDFHGDRYPLESLDAQAKRWTQLTVAQLKSSLLPFPASNYWFYRFWNSLDAKVRDRLRNGEKIPLGNLPGSSREFLYAAGEGNEKPNTFNASITEAGPFAESEYLDHGYILEHTKTRKLELPTESGPFRHSTNDFAVLYPNALGKDACVSVQKAVISAVYNPDEDRVIAPSLIVQIDNDTDSQNRLAHLKAATITAYRFHFVLREGVEVCADITEATSGETLSADRTKWPADLLDRMNKQRLLFNAYFSDKPARPG